MANYNKLIPSRTTLCETQYIEPVDYADVEAIHALHVAARAANPGYLIARSPEDFHKAAGKGDLFAAVDARGPCGMIMLVSAFKRNASALVGDVQLSSLAVLPDYEGLGIARGLIDFALHVAEHRGYKAAFARVAADNARCQSVFEKCGFQVSSKTARDDGTPVSVLLRDLTARP